MPLWKKSFYAIFAAEFLAIAGFNTSTPILPFFLQDLGVTDPDELKFWIGIINSLSSLVLAIMAPIWGKLADSYGRRPMLLRAMFGGTVVISLIGFSTNPTQFLVLRTIQGAVTGTVAAATVLVASMVPAEELGFRLGLLQTSIFIGSSVGPLIGGVIADLFGNDVTFFVTAGMLALAGVIVMVGVKESFTPEDHEPFSLKKLFPDMKPLVESKDLMFLIVLIGVIQVANNVIYPVLPLYIQQMSPGIEKVGSITGLILGVSAFAGALAAAVMGKFAYRIGYARSLLFNLTAAAIFCIPQALVRTPLLLLVFRTGSSFFMGSVIPGINVLIGQRADKNRQGSIYGIATSINSLGVAVGPVIGATIAVAASFSSIFYATALLLAVSALATKRFFPESKPEPAA